MKSQLFLSLGLFLICRLQAFLFLLWLLWHCLLGCAGKFSVFITLFRHLHLISITQLLQCLTVLLVYTSF